MPFSDRPFLFWGQFYRIKVFLIFRPFWTVGKFLPSWSEAEKLACSDKKNIMLSNLVPRVPSFYIRTKSKLKNRVTIVHFLQCKTNFFIRLCFWGEKSTQIKKHPSWEASITIKKIFLIRLDSSTFVNTRLQSSRFV